uniref:UDP-glucosyltransferase B1 n=1 Tax=Starmerella bombicola TaxID=75736 RepID=UGTB1_STABO|nr:RecName: Full=UDP-glucosyltransferase B1; Short=GTII [Starmerella bombicola]ADT71703.1 UDP-glucosyltransferase [Starmerella bombicola]
MAIEKPVIVACACPLAGHVGPVLSLVRGLLNRGYEVTFVTGNAFKEKVIEAGCTFVPLQGRADYHEYNLPEIAPGLLTIPPGLEQTGYSMNEIFVKAIPEQYDALQTALKQVEAENKSAVVIGETMFLGVHPISLGAPGLKPQGVITLGTIPCMLKAEKAPGVPSLEPMIDTLVRQQVFQPGTDSEKEIMKTLGATKEPEFLLENIYSSPDRFLQLCPPSLEFHLTSPPPGFSFAGSAPHVKSAGLATPPHLPSWWPDVLSAKRLIVVTQGTAAINYEDLLIPALQAFADEEDTLVVGILGVKGASLPDSVKVPANARIVDYFPYDELLPHASVFIYNGGYGGLQHSLSHGVPVIIGGGMLVDKPAVASRAVWAGVGYDLQTLQATSELVSTAVKEVLATPSYHEKAMAVKKELEKYKSLDILESAISELAS